MRMRKRHNLDARMERCAELLIEEPESLRGWIAVDFATARLAAQIYGANPIAS